MSKVKGKIKQEDKPCPWIDIDLNADHETQSKRMKTLVPIENNPELPKVTNAEVENSQSSKKKRKPRFRRKQTPTFLIDNPNADDEAQSKRMKTNAPIANNPEVEIPPGLQADQVENINHCQSSQKKRKHKAKHKTPRPRIRRKQTPTFLIDNPNADDEAQSKRMKTDAPIANNPEVDTQPGCQAEVENNSRCQSTKKKRKYKTPRPISRRKQTPTFLIDNLNADDEAQSKRMKTDAPIANNPEVDTQPGCQAEVENNSHCQSTKKKRKPKPTVAWSFEERTKLVEAIHFDGGRNNFNLMQRIIKSGDKTKTNTQNYVKYLRNLELGLPFKQFLDKTPIDVWLELTDNVPEEGDKSAEVCIPQTMTVAALEPGLPQPAYISGGNSYGPCFANVYNFLAVILKGDDPPKLPPIDSKVVIELLEELINKLANSHTLMQKEYMHEAFESLNEQTESVYFQEGQTTPITNKDSSDQPLSRHTKPVKASFPSMNPLKVPINILEFKPKGPKVYDVGLKWKTTYSIDKF